MPDLERLATRYAGRLCRGAEPPTGGDGVERDELAIAVRQDFVGRPPLATAGDERRKAFRIVTDAMDMQGLASLYNTGESAVRSIEAGSDVLLMPRKAEDAINGVLAAIESALAQT